MVIETRLNVGLMKPVTLLRYCYCGPSITVNRATLLHHYRYCEPGGTTNYTVPEHVLVVMLLLLLLINREAHRLI